MSGIDGTGVGGLGAGATDGRPFAETGRERAQAIAYMQTAIALRCWTDFAAVSGQCARAMQGFRDAFSAREPERGR